MTWLLLSDSGRQIIGHLNEIFIDTLILLSHAIDSKFNALSRIEISFPMQAAHHFPRRDNESSLSDFILSLQGSA